MVSFTTEPDRNEITESNPAVTATQPILTPQEIYQLLDDERWSKGVIEARRLLAAEPSSGLAYLTLGDALSHYPNGDGDIYLAFEAWMTAKTLTPSRSSLNKIAQKRLAWALERSGIIKLEPSTFVGTNGFGEGIRVEAFSHLELDWSSRIEASRGSVYITNIPPGTVVLKITSDLGVYVTSVSLEAGSFQTVSVPTETESAEANLIRWVLPYLETGRQAIDAVVQSTIVDPGISLTTLQIRWSYSRKPLCQRVCDNIHQSIQWTYCVNNGARQTLIGGLYVLEVDKNGKKTYRYRSPFWFVCGNYTATHIEWWSSKVWEKAQSFVKQWTILRWWTRPLRHRSLWTRRGTHRSNSYWNGDTEETDTQTTLYWAKCR